MKSETFEMHRETMEETVALAMDNKVVCDGCHEIVNAEKTLSSVTDGTLCFSCMCK